MFTLDKNRKKIKHWRFFVANDLNKDLLSTNRSVASVDPVQNLAQHFTNLQKKVGDLETRMELTNDRLMDLATASKERFSRIQSTISNMEYNFKNHSNDFKHELNTLQGQLTQKRVVDTRVQDLIQKHSEQVTLFEKRLQDLKKQIQGQDMKLMDAFSRISLFPK